MTDAYLQQKYYHRGDYTISEDEWPDVSKDEVRRLSEHSLKYFRENKEGENSE